MRAAILSTAMMATFAFGEVAQSPLFLGTRVSPNIFFMVDDSGSMDWEILKSDGAMQISAYSSLNNSGSLDITPTRNDQDEVLEACAGYNVLYFDPNIEYSPWSGTDAFGNPYPNQPINRAAMNPYRPDLERVDLTGRDGGNSRVGYFAWQDDGDGVFERGECPDPYLAGYNYNRDFISVADMDAATQQNFANWYSYYRKREYVVKAAMLNITNRSDARLGLATLHSNSDVGMQVADISQGNNRQALMTEIAQIYSRGGTPLRTRLDWVGKYFEDQKPSQLFPNQSTPATPILSADQGGTCQQNFAVVMSDGYWNGTSPEMGNADGDGDGPYDGGAYGDSYDNTLADVAMHYYERDLAPGLANNVPTNPQDGNSAQHLVTYTVAFGVNGSLTESPADASQSFAWPQPESNRASTVDDLRHAAYNGRGEFLNAANPNALAQAFTQAIASIEGRVASAASVAANTTQLSTRSRLFQARFDSSNWSGQLLAYALDPASGSPTQVIWDASEKMPDWNQRSVFTSSGQTGVAFSWAQLPASLQGQLNRHPDTGVIDNQGQARLNYLLGDATYEGNRYPARADNGSQGNLGDIVNSNPFYVTPRADFGYQRLPGQAARYRQFMLSKRQNNTPEMLYVGANDGMLHAFRSDGDERATCQLGQGKCAGEELFAFVPAALHNDLTQLTNRNSGHRYYVDGSAVVADALVGDAWQSVLVGTLGAGGKGLFALDVSTPDQFAASDVHWDLTASDFSSDAQGRSDLGYMLGEPAIVRMANGKFAAVTGNGFDSDSGRALLYIIPLDNPSAMIALSTDQGSPTQPNGLASPLTIDLNHDRIVDAIYAGDLQGNMWKFDVSDVDSSKWSVAYQQNNQPTPLFRACQDAQCQQPQPITAKPQAMRHQNGVMVVFGTGQYYRTTDTQINSNGFNSFYAIFDDGNPVSNRNSLLAQEITAQVTTSKGRNARVTSDKTLNLATKDGWYLDFSTVAGERVVVEPVVRHRRVIFPTLIPSDDPCAFGGSSWLMELDVTTGGRLPEPPLDVNQDGKVDQNDLVTTDPDKPAVVASGVESEDNIIGRPAIVADEQDEYKQFSGSSGEIETIVEDSPIEAGRQSWIQLR